PSPTSDRGIGHRYLRRLDVVCLWRRDTPMIRAARWPGPFGGAAHDVAVIDLQHLGGVFDDEAAWINEIGKDIIAGTVTTDAPGNRKAGADKAPGAAQTAFAVSSRRA